MPAQLYVVCAITPGRCDSPPDYRFLRPFDSLFFYKKSISLSILNQEGYCLVLPAGIAPLDILHLPRCTQDNTICPHNCMLSALSRLGGATVHRTIAFSARSIPSSFIKNQYPSQFLIKRDIVWYSRRESNPQRPLRRGLLYPFNYGSILHVLTRVSVRCNTVRFYF